MNTYALFAESVYRMTEGAGCAGIVVPTGIATDDTTKVFFSTLVENRRLASLYDFENREGLFAEVDSRMKFCAVTFGSAQTSEFAFFATRVSEVADPRRRFRLAPSDFKLINPNTRTCPTFRSSYDAELTKAVYQRVPVLINEAESEQAGNPWGMSFSQGLFNMAADSALFRPSVDDEALPLYEAKMIHQFEHRWSTYEASEARALTGNERMDVRLTVRPRYWVHAEEVNARLASRGWTRQWLLGWRDITNATNERTVIASVLPRVAVGHKVPLGFSDMEPPRLAVLLGDMNSLVHDYIARQKLGGTSLAHFVKKQIPHLPPAAYDGQALEFLVPRVLELTYTATDLTPWGRDLGYDGPPFRWDPDRRAVLRAELDAWYAHAYGLTRDELRYVLDPADVMGPDWPSETFRVLKNNEERQFGEYRTRRLVLEAWDRLFGR